MLAALSTRPDSIQRSTAFEERFEDTWKLCLSSSFLLLFLFLINLVIRALENTEFVILLNLK